MSDTQRYVKKPCSNLSDLNMRNPCVRRNELYMKKWLKSLAIGIFTLSVVSCSPALKKTVTKQLQRTESDFQDHVGFMLYDPVREKVILDYNASKYFTPASNTKIFTFFAGLSVLGDSIPALQYVCRGDSLIFRGTGDPSFLNRRVCGNTNTYDFLKSTDKKLFFYPFNFHTSHFGYGWSWEDYTYAFSSERSSFPIYGNVFEVFKLSPSSLIADPVFFRSFLNVGDTLQKESKLIRLLESNSTTYFPGREERIKHWTVPYRSESSLQIRLLEDTLKTLIQMIDYFPAGEVQTIFSVPSDSLYKVMMQQSDNFIAEQLLLLCANALSDSLKPEIAISHVSDMLLHDLPDKPVWIDGSGLSRYNLFTPRSIVKLWEKIYQRIPEERLFSIIAIGGRPGTLKNYFKSETPYVFGKTGTLSNVHCLSGFLKTKKGRTLIFSFMNTNFTAPVRDVRNNMEVLLNKIHQKY